VLQSSAPVATPPHLYPTVAQAQARRAAALESPFAAGAASGSGGGPLVYRGGQDGIGVTTGQPKVYVVFWGSQWGTNTPAGSTNFSNDPARVAPRVVALLAGIGTNGEMWSGVLTQYCEGIEFGDDICPSTTPHVGYPTGGALAGVWADTATPAPTTATGHDLANEAINAAAHFGNTTAVSNRNAQYVIVSATGTHPGGFGTNSFFCAWHDNTYNPGFGVTSPYGDLAFTNLPYVPDAGTNCGESFVNAGAAGNLDGVTIVEGHEYAETITDQIPNHAWSDAIGSENADKCAWIHTGQGAAANVSFATGSFAMQSTWSNDGGDCLMSHPIWGTPGGNRFIAEIPSSSSYVQPGDTATTSVETATTSGSPQPLSLSISGTIPDGTVTLPTSITSDDVVTLTVTTSGTTPFGVYQFWVTVQGTAQFRMRYTVTVGPPPSALQSGVAVTELSGPAGSDQIFTFDVPDGYWLVGFTLGGGTGDADLYVKRDAIPTDRDYECRSITAGTEETCTLLTPAGHWYVRVHGADSFPFTFSGVGVQATYAAPSLVKNNQTLTLDGLAGSQQFFWFNMPSDQRRLKVRIKEKTAGADLFVRAGALPGPVLDGCPRSRHLGHRNETCTIRRPPPFSFFIAVYGATDFSGATLTLAYK
jgi:serine protease